MYQSNFTYQWNQGQPASFIYNVSILHTQREIQQIAQGNEWANLKGVKKNLAFPPIITGPDSSRLMKT